MPLLSLNRPALPTLDTGFGAADPYRLKHLALNGIPDHPVHLRPHIWRLLFHLPENHTSPNLSMDPNQRIRRSREEYHNLIDEFTHGIFSSPSSGKPCDQPPPSQSSWVIPEHVLNLIGADVARTQNTLSFFNQTRIIDSRDDADLYAFKLQVMTTKLDHLDPCYRPQHHRLLRPQWQSSDSVPLSGIPPRLNVQAPTPVSPRSPSAEADPITCSQSQIAQVSDLEQSCRFGYRDLLTRFLSIWATLNPGIGYVQGMNEIGAVLIYVFSLSQPQLADPGPQSPPAQFEGEDDFNMFENLEADAFWAFNSLMTSVRDLFTKSFDAHSPLDTIHIHSARSTHLAGFARVLYRYQTQLAILDSDLTDWLQSICVGTHEYLVNWLGSLFSRCFHLPDLIKVWDTILAIKVDQTREQDDSSQVLDYLVDLSCAMTLRIKDHPQYADHVGFGYVETIQALQDFKNWTHVDVDQVIQSGLLIRQKRLARDFFAEEPQKQQVPTPHQERRLQLDSLDGHRIDLVAQERPIGLSHLGDIPSDMSFDPGLKNSLSPHWESQSVLSPVQTPRRPRVHSEASPQGLLGKWISKAEGWKDSDAAATISKKATNWTIMASSWRPPSLASKLSGASNLSEQAAEEMSSTRPPSEQLNGSPSTFQHAWSPSSSAIKASSPPCSSPSATSNRWSKTSSTSVYSVEGIHHHPLPGSSGRTSSGRNSSAASSYLGSPAQSHHHGIGQPGPKPLLLRSRARTNIQVADAPSETGLLQQMMTTPLMKKLNGLYLNREEEVTDYTATPCSKNMSSQVSPSTVLAGKSSRLMMTNQQGNGSSSCHSCGGEGRKIRVSIGRVPIEGGRSRPHSAFSLPDRHSPRQPTKRPERSSLPQIEHCHHPSSLYAAREYVTETITLRRLQTELAIHSDAMIDPSAPPELETVATEDLVNDYMSL